ncbi:MAG TPA: pyridoxamine 5'-phosphate oxidase family protein [Dehalococcoidia bacterium]|nr:pyridoxamine 5'-phosphate oxidase family protein [Dehalococcoidia bacterium]
MAELPLEDPVVAELVGGPNLARLAYVGRNGRPHVVPIWCMYRDGAFVMVTGPKADKVAALERNAAVALTIDSSKPPYHVLLIDGDATVEATEGMAPEYPEIVQRYLGAAAEAYLAPMRDRVKTQRRIRVTVRSWRVLDFVKRFPKSLR